MEELVFPFLDLSKITLNPSQIVKPELTLDLGKIGKEPTLVEPVVSTALLKTEQPLENLGKANNKNESSAKDDLTSSVFSLLESLKIKVETPSLSVEKNLASPVNRFLSAESPIQNTQNIFNSERFLNTLSRAFNSTRLSQNIIDSTSNTTNSAQANLANQNLSTLFSTSVLGINQSLENTKAAPVELGESRSSTLPMVESIQPATIALSQGQDLISSMLGLSENSAVGRVGPTLSEPKSSQFELSPVLDRVESLGQTQKMSLPITQEMKAPVIPPSLLASISEMTSGQQRVVESISNQTTINQAASGGIQPIQLTGGPQAAPVDETSGKTNNIMLGSGGGDQVGLASLLSVLNKIHAALSSPLRIRT